MNALTTKEPKPQVVAGGRLAALVPQNVDEAYRLAQALAAAGEMVPKHFQGKPQEIMAAIMRGMEVGLAPMQSLSSIAVINGRATIWGDALPALMQRAGHQLDVEVTGQGDDMVATATLVRGDTGQRIVRSFSASDAKAAGLWGKAGPWQQYKPRMLSMRARTLACRDGAADALMGLQVAEEVQDYPRDVTPREAPVSRFAQIAKGAPPPAEVEPIDEPRQPRHWTEGYAPRHDGFPTDAFDKGVRAHAEGVALDACPYDEGLEEADQWVAGWLGAKEAKATPA